MKLQCPSCKTILEGEVSYLGTENECPSCHKMVRIIQYNPQNQKKTSFGIKIINAFKSLAWEELPIIICLAGICAVGLLYYQHISRIKKEEEIVAKKEAAIQEEIFRKETEKRTKFREDRKVFLSINTNFSLFDSCDVFVPSSIGRSSILTTLLPDGRKWEGKSFSDVDFVFGKGGVSFAFTQNDLKKGNFYFLYLGKFPSQISQSGILETNRHFSYNGSYIANNAFGARCVVKMCSESHETIILQNGVYYSPSEDFVSLMSKSDGELHYIAKIELVSKNKSSSTSKPTWTYPYETVTTTYTTEIRVIGLYLFNTKYGAIYDVDLLQ